MAANHLVQSAVKQVVELLVAKRYEQLSAATRGDRLTGKMIETAIVEYGRELVSPPNSAYESIDVVSIAGSCTGRWSARFALWTVEEGRSDLTLEITVNELAGSPCITLDDLHIL